MNFVNSIITVFVFIFVYSLSWFVVYWVGTLIKDVNDQLSRTTLQDGFQFLCGVMAFIFFIFAVYFTCKFNLYWRII